MPVISATQEAVTRESLEPRRRRCSEGGPPLHSSLSDGTRLSKKGHHSPPKKDSKSLGGDAHPDLPKKELETLPRAIKPEKKN